MKGMEGIPTAPGGSRLFGLDSRRAGLVAAHAHVPGLPSWNLVRPWRTSPLPGAHPKSQRPTPPAQSARLLHPLHPLHPCRICFLLFCRPDTHSNDPGLLGVGIWNVRRLFKGGPRVCHPFHSHPGRAKQTSSAVRMRKGKSSSRRR